ncbi:MAG: pilus assembly protein [Rhizomicrobium sp.]|nr:pilus assembly protein [Rhizomicrobium sp.]
MEISTLAHLASRFRRANGGNIAWIYALSLVPMMLAAGGAVDMIAAIDAKTSLQNAIDAATLAGAGASNSTSVASNTFAAEPAGKFAVNGTPSFSVNGDSSFTGTVTASVATKFLAVAGINTLSIAATATAKQGNSSTACILVLNKTSSQSLLLNSGADIEASKCEAHIASTGAPAAIFNSGTTLNTAKTCIAGTSIISNGGTHPNVITGCTVAADPFAGNLPVPNTSCTYTNYSPPNSSAFTMQPGVYCGWVNFNGAPTITFAAGTYVIKNGGWNVNGGSWSGAGVTFYFADTSKIQFNSAVQATLSAPTSGTYDGILMYEAAGLSASQFIFDDSKGHTLSGLIYLPSRQMVMNAGANTVADAVTLVVDTLIMNTATWYVTPAGSKTIAGSGGGGSAYLVK